MGWRRVDDNSLLTLKENNKTCVLKRTVQEGWSDWDEQLKRGQ